MLGQCWAIVRICNGDGDGDEYEAETKVINVRYLREYGSVQSRGFGQ